MIKSPLLTFSTADALAGHDAHINCLIEAFLSRVIAHRFGREDSGGEKGDN